MPSYDGFFLHVAHCCCSAQLGLCKYRFFFLDHLDLMGIQVTSVVYSVTVTQSW